VIVNFKKLHKTQHNFFKHGSSQIANKIEDQNVVKYGGSALYDNL
jgi:hypothetical protein